MPVGVVKTRGGAGIAVALTVTGPGDDGPREDDPDDQQRDKQVADQLGLGGGRAAGRGDGVALPARISAASEFGEASSPHLDGTERWSCPPRAQPGGSDPRRRGRRIIQSSAGDARSLKRTRYALWKNPDNLTGRQQAKLAWIEKTHPYLYRAWLLKEGIRVIFALKGQPEAAREAPARWLQWAARSRIPQFVEPGLQIRKHQAGILASNDNSMSNGLIESVNTKVRLITRVAYGFHGPQALIALAMLSLGGQRPALPGR